MSVSPSLPGADLAHRVADDVTDEADRVAHRLRAILETFLARESGR